MINLILISIVLNFFLISFHKRINFFSVYGKEKDKFISLIGGNILIINLIVFFLYSTLDNNISLDDFFLDKRKLFSLFIGAIGIYFMGIFDDKYNLKPLTKILLMLFFIFFTVIGDTNLLINKLKFEIYEIDLAKYNLFFSIFCFIVFINAINMFDGINLQVSIYSIFLLIYLFLNNFYQYFCLFLIISLIFFSILNAKNISFLGNSGSHFLGFLFSYLLIKFYNLNNEFIYAEEIVILMLVPGLDMLRVSLKRIISGNNPLKGDLNHLHHIIKNKLNSGYALLINFIITIAPIMLYKSLELHAVYIILAGIFGYYFVFFLFKRIKTFE